MQKIYLQKSALRREMVGGPADFQRAKQKEHKN